MTWEAAGAMGEIAGALAVVMSLFYLAVQLRNQNRESRAAAMHDIWSEFRESLSLLGDSQFSAVYAKSLNEQELTDAEQLQLLVTIQVIHRVWEEAFMQWKRGRLDDDVWDSMLRQIKISRGSRPFVHVWSLRKEVFGPEYQDFIDQLPLSQYDLRSESISEDNA